MLFDKIVLYFFYSSFGNAQPETFKDIKVIEIPSWTIRKGNEEQDYCSYRVHVYLKSGIRWVVDKRFSDFRNLRSELNKVRPDLKVITFPKKRWFFNFSESFLEERKQHLCNYLRGLVLANPIPMELDPFLSITSYVREFSVGGTSSLSIQKSLSTGEMGSFIAAGITVNDFQLLKVLGRGSFGKVFLVRLLGEVDGSVYAMKVLAKATVEKRNQVHSF